MSKIGFPCGNCSYLSCNETQQQEAKREGIDMNHYCKKYNKRLFHYTNSRNHSPEIYACEECDNQTYNKLDKYIFEKSSVVIWKMTLPLRLNTLPQKDFLKLSR